MLCFVHKRTPTNENNSGTEWRGIEQLLPYTYTYIPIPIRSASLANRSSSLANPSASLQVCSLHLSHTAFFEVPFATAYSQNTDTIFAVFIEMERRSIVFYSLNRHEKDILIDSLTFINQRRSRSLSIR